jgi:phosphotransferase system HPr (HPr) family protein
MPYQASVTVHDPIGLHARPAGQIVKLVKESGFEVQLTNDSGVSAAASSALRMMAMKVKSGEVLTVTVETDDDSAAAAIVEQIQDFLKG